MKEQNNELLEGLDELSIKDRFAKYMSKSETLRYVKELFNREADLIDRKYK